MNVPAFTWLKAMKNALSSLKKYYTKTKSTPKSNNLPRHLSQSIHLGT